MNASLVREESLARRITACGTGTRWLWDGLTEVTLAAALGESRVDQEGARLAGRSVLIQTPDQLSAALALIQLDGIAKRLILCPPDLEPRHLTQVIQDAEVEVLIDGVGPGSAAPVQGTWLPRRPGGPVPSPAPANGGARATEWVLFTSGTTDRPKMVLHSLQGLIGAIGPHKEQEPPLWATFYDIRRYGGLQMLLRACLGGGSMILSRSEESVGEFLIRLGQRGATHIAATPSHWRKALMSPAIEAIRPKYLRLSGEIADQSILDRLSHKFPDVPIAHAYASTEAGVGFEVVDGLAGFPARLLDQRSTAVEIKVVDGALKLRSERTASRYLNPSDGPLADDEGFVDTGDMLERRGERFYFVGRRGGIINVGGLKVHPEEVEAVINRQAGVRMSLVKARKSPIMGAIVVAEVVAEPDQDHERLRTAILAACQAALARFKTPASIRFVEALTVTSGASLSENMRNVLVTGASRGLGLAIVERLARDGFRVVGVARGETPEFKRCAEAATSRPGEIHFVSFDLSQIDALADLARATRTRFGPVYGLINNAGVSAEGLLANMPLSQIETVVRLNTLSPIVLSKFVVRGMMAEGAGRVVNIASIAASTGFNGLAAYAASKASMVGFTKSLAREVGRLGITVNAVAPGFVDTDMTLSLKPVDRQRIAKRSALRRLADPQDVASAVSYLMSEDARSVTGAVLTVDAGATA